MVLTNQQIFTKIVEYSRTLTKTGIPKKCMYRNPEGRNCFIGALIPDTLYNPIIEGVGMADIEQDSRQARKLKDIISRLGISVEQYSLLKELQGIHDGVYGSPEIWEDRFEILASRYNLQVPPVEKSHVSN